MKLNLRSGATIAITAAALIISGAPLIGAAHAEDAKGHCQGVNGCKGQGGSQYLSSTLTVAAVNLKCHIRSRASMAVHNDLLPMPVEAENITSDEDSAERSSAMRVRCRACLFLLSLSALVKTKIGGML